MRSLRILGLIMLCGLLSCDLFESKEGHCPPVQGTWFKVKDMQVLNMRNQPGCCLNKVPPYGKVEYNYFLLNLEMDVSYYAFRAAPKPGLFNTAYALSCPENGQNGCKESIREIAITTLFDLDENHKKGAIVNDLFDIDQMGGRMGIDDFLSSDECRIQQPVLGFLLHKKPVLSDTCAFKFQINLDNQTQYTCISAPVIIK